MMTQIHFMCQENQQTALDYYWLIKSVRKSRHEASITMNEYS